jgi:hypothetical protein
MPGVMDVKTALTKHAPQRWRVLADSCVLSASWSPHGRRLAAASINGSIQVIDVSSGNVERAFQGHRFGATAVQWHPAGKQLATAGQDGRVRLWNPASDTPPNELDGGTPCMVVVRHVPSECCGAQAASLERTRPAGARVSASPKYDSRRRMESTYGRIRERLLRPRPHLESRNREPSKDLPLEGVNALLSLEPRWAISLPRQSGLHSALLDCEERRGSPDVGISPQGSGTRLGSSLALPCHRRRAPGDHLGLRWTRACQYQAYRSQIP